MMKKKQKKILKRVGIGLGIILAILIAIPLFLESKMGDLVRANVNKNIKGEFDFDKANLSLISSFPNAELNFSGARIINAEPFRGDTLFYAGDASITMALSEVFKGMGEPLDIRRLQIENARMDIRVDSLGQANYDIAGETPGDTTAVQGFQFNLQHYEILDSRVSYEDAGSDIRMQVTDIQHKGDGDLSLSDTKLDTYTEAFLSFYMDGVQYLQKNPVKLNALIGVDLEESRYTFLENEGMVNDLPLVFDGYVQVYEDYQDVVLDFQTPSSEFRNFLAVIPVDYRGSLEGVETQGDFKVSGKLRGRSDDTYIPKMDILISSDNAAFKFPDLPRRVSDIRISAEIKNTTGIPEDTFVAIEQAAFRIGEDRFSMSSTIRELLGNPKVDAKIDADMELAHLSEAYPVPDGFDMSGHLVADVETAFDMNSIEQQQYQNTRTSGKVMLSNFKYKPEALPNSLNLSEVTMDFTPSRVNLKRLKGKTGRSDFAASGSISNLLGYMFSEEPLKGNFTLESGVFDLADFMPRAAEATETSGGTSTSGGEKEPMRIPSFLDATLDARAGTVYYDDLELTGLKGVLKLSESKAILQGVTAQLLGGTVNLSGEVDTGAAIPQFRVDLGLDTFRISEAFQQLDMLQALAPIAAALDGTFNSSLQFNGTLDGDLAPLLPSLSGNALAEVITSEINTGEQKYLALLDDKLNFINLDSIDLKGLKTYLSFDQGRVAVKPFDIKYKDFQIAVQGSHGFQSDLEYKATLEVPAKYLGNEVTKLLSQLQDTEVEDLTIPVVATIGGSFSAPTVRTDLASGVQKLTSRLLEVQKQRATEQGKEKAKDILGGLLGKRDTTAASDTTKSQSIEKTVGDVLGGSRDTVPGDSTPKQGEQVKEAARNVLGNLLKKKPKDSVDQ